jgi:hypothetical protein
MADPVIKKSGVYQRFNLKEMFGVDVSDSPEVKRAIAQAIIDVILERTENGLAKGGKRSLKAPYSDEYAASLPFKANGKSKGKVNMTLNGDMLGLLDMIDETPNTITIGWVDEKENLKAYNHNVGDTVPKRDFFGLTKGEIKEITQRFKSEVQEYKEEKKSKAPKSERQEKRDAFTERALEFLDRLEGQGEGVE